MTAIDMSKADEPNAKLTLKLSAKSGYRADAEYPGISANQWSRVLAVCEGKEQYRVIAAARDLLEALEPFARTEVLEPNGVIVGLERCHFDRARAAIAKAQGAAA